MEKFPKKPIELPGDAERLPNLGLELRDYVEYGAVALDEAGQQALQEIIGALNQNNPDEARRLCVVHQNKFGKSTLRDRLEIGLYRNRDRESPWFRSAA